MHTENKKKVRFVPCCDIVETCRVDMVPVVNLHLHGGDYFEIATFLFLIGFSGTCVPVPEEGDGSVDFRRTFLFIMACLPACYSASYAFARVYFALSHPIRKDSTFRFHRISGSIGLSYVLVAWYKLVVQGGVDSTLQPPPWDFVDTVLRTLAVAATTFNTLTGIIMLPHINTKTPLLLRQAFSAAICLSVGSGLLQAILVFRVHEDYLSLDTRTIVYLGAASLKVVGVMVNWLGFIMGLRAVQLMSDMEEFNQSHRVKKSDGDASTLEKDGTTRRRGRPTVASFFYDVFINPRLYSNTQYYRSEGEETILLPKNQGQAATIASIAGPGFFMGLLATNAVFQSRIPALSPNLVNPRVVNYSMNCLDLMNIAVLPANLFDLTLVLRKRLDPVRGPAEIVASVIFSTLVGPIALSLFCLSSTDFRDFGHMLRVLLWPLLGTGSF